MIGVWLEQELWRARFGLVPRAVFGLMPLVLLPVLRPLGTEALSLSEGRHLDGSLILGPGLATIFAIVSMVFFGLTCFDERRWGTSRRHEMSGSYGLPALGAKSLVTWGQLILQFGLAMVAFRWLFGYRPAASWFWFVPLVVAGTASIVALALVFVAAARTLSEFNLFPFIGAVLLVGIGSGLMPEEYTPPWATTVAPLFPTTHLLKGMAQLSIDGRTDAVVPQTMLIFAMTAALVALAQILTAKVRHRR